MLFGMGTVRPSLSVMVFCLNPVSCMIPMSIVQGNCIQMKSTNGNLTNHNKAIPPHNYFSKDYTSKIKLKHIELSILTLSIKSLLGATASRTDQKWTISQKHVNTHLPTTPTPPHCHSGTRTHVLSYLS